MDGATEVAGDAAPGEAMIDPRHESVATLEDFTVTIPPSSTIDGERLVLSAAERAPNLGVSGLRIVDGIAVTLSAGQLVRPLTVTLQVPAPSDEAAVPVALWEGADGVRAVPVSVERDGDAQLITLSTKDLTQGWFGWLEPGPIAEEALAGLSEAYLIKEHTSQPRCTEEDASREIIEVSSDRGDPVLWCAGLGGDLPYVVIANNRLSVLQLAGPVSWTVTGDLTLPIASLTDTFGEVVQPLVSTYPENLTVSLMPPGDSVTLSATEPVQGPVELRARATGLGHLITVLDHGLTTFANISGGLGAPQEWATLSQELLQGRTLGIPAQVIAEWGQCLGGFTEITSREPWQSLEPDEITPVTEHAIDCFAQIAQAGLG
ncbi:MAG: hypothetical protein Q4G67_02405, partial [Actinomycetia bacterium]|nr:hypothetical protein [Actinomycetes bacterium]